jgi:hypothetical protein
MGLGAKSEISNHFGLAFVKASVKHPFLTGAHNTFFFKYPVDKAKEVANNARFAFIGEVVAPWSFHSYSGWTDADSMKAMSLHTRYAAVNLICAAVVDERGFKILHEFK